jgi:hypothetical protein
MYPRAVILAMRWRLTEVQARSNISLRTFRKISLVLGRPGSPLGLTLLFGSERVLSKAGDLISEKRNRLAPGTADTFMCLRYWLGLPEITEEAKKRFEQSQEDGKENEFLVEHYLPEDDGDDGDDGDNGDEDADAEENDEENYM